MLPLSRALVVLAGTRLLTSAHKDSSASITGPSPNSKSCAFNGTFGPNIMIASVELPDNSTEIRAWIYGYNWCSHSNFVSKSVDICRETSGSNKPVEFMHIPLTDKFGQFDWDCYANVDVWFKGCNITDPGGKGIKDNVRNVTACITAMDGSSTYEYQCVDEVEHHACIYDSQIHPASEVEYTAFMSVGRDLRFIGDQDLTSM